MQLNIETPIPGIQTCRTKEGVRLIRVHYTADEDKDPQRDGKEWFARELVGYKGIDDPRWRKEMEIDFKAMGGQLLFPYLGFHEKSIFVPPFDVSGIKKIAGLDYGPRSPSAFEVRCKVGDDLYNVHEYYEEPIGKSESEEEFKKRKGYKALCRAILSYPDLGDVQFIFADPQLWERTQETKHGFTTIAALFQEEGVHLTPGRKGGDFAYYERMNNDYWADPDKPKYKIFKTCVWLWYECKRLRFAEWAAASQVNRNLREEIVDRDNHAWDACKYRDMGKPSSMLEMMDVEGCLY